MCHDDYRGGSCGCNATVTGGQLRLRSDILDFNVFPYSEKTGDNVKSWFLQVLNQNQIKHNMVSGITPDGAVDGPMRLGGGQVFQKTNASGLSRMVY